MPAYEYKVVPAPEKGVKGKGLKGVRERFAHALESLMNELGADGWEYVRADMLPCEERSGLTGSSVVYQNMLVFRRPRGARREPAVSFDPEVSYAPATSGPAQPAPATADDAEPWERPRQSAPEAVAPAEPAPAPAAPAAQPKSPETAGAAAAAAAAALTAYRGAGTGGGARKIGPAKPEE